MSIIDQLEEALKNYQALAEEARKASAAIRDADEQTLGNMTKMNNLRADAQRSVRQLSAARIKLDQEKKKALKTNQAEVDQIEELTKAEGEFKDTMRDVKGAVDIAAQATNKLAGAQSDAGKAADGTATQFRNMFGAAVAVTQVFRTFGATNYLYERLQKGIDEQSEKMVASFGQVRTEAGDFADTLSGRLMQGTDELGQEILKLEYRLDNVNEPLKFLPPGIAGSQKAFELFRTAAESLAPVINAIPGQLEGSQKALLTLQEVLGASAEDLSGFGNMAVIFGTTVEGQMAVAAEASRDMAKAYDVNQKQVAKATMTMRKDFANFGTFSTSEIAKVAAEAQKLGVSLQGVVKLNVFDSFDKAAEGAAMLSQAFGINVDAFELFQEEDPTERLKMLQEAALNAGIDVTNFSRVELKYFSDLTGGLPEEDILKAMSSGNIDKLMDVKGPVKSRDEELARITQLQGENAKLSNDFLSSFGPQIQQYIASASEIQTALVDRALGAEGRRRIVRDQAKIMFQIGGQTMQRVLENQEPAINSLFTGLAEANEGVLKMVDAALQPLADPNIGFADGFKDFATALSEGGVKLTNAVDQIGADLTRGAKELFDDATGVKGSGKQALRSLYDFLAGNSKLMQQLLRQLAIIFPESAKAAGDFIITDSGDLIQPSANDTIMGVQPGGPLSDPANMIAQLAQSTPDLFTAAQAARAVAGTPMVARATVPVGIDAGGMRAGAAQVSGDFAPNVIVNVVMENDVVAQAAARGNPGPRGSVGNTMGMITQANGGQSPLNYTGRASI